MEQYFTHVTALAALAVVAVQEILKLKIIPISIANRYPVPTLILLSMIASLGVVWQTTLMPVAWTDWVLLVSTVAVVAAIVYNMTFKNWAQLKAMEGEG
jgi:hypothetical protein